MASLVNRLGLSHKTQGDRRASVSKRDAISGSNPGGLADLAHGG